MKFDKQVIFLGMVAHSLNDGGTYYTVSLFDQEAGPIQVNVMDTESNRIMTSDLLSCTFGVPLDVTFVLRPKERLYRLTLASVHA